MKLAISTQSILLIFTCSTLTRVVLNETTFACFGVVVPDVACSTLTRVVLNETQLPWLRLSALGSCSTLTRVVLNETRRSIRPKSPHASCSTLTRVVLNETYPGCHTDCRCVLLQYPHSGRPK